MVGKGRPATGVRIEVRIPADLLATIDELAAGEGVRRPEMIRRLLADAVQSDRSP